MLPSLIDEKLSFSLLFQLEFPRLITKVGDMFIKHLQLLLCEVPVYFLSLFFYMAFSFTYWFRISLDSCPLLYVTRVSSNLWVIS